MSNSVHFIMRPQCEIIELDPIFKEVAQVNIMDKRAINPIYSKPLMIIASDEEKTKIE